MFVGIIVVSSLGVDILVPLFFLNLHSCRSFLFKISFLVIVFIQFLPLGHFLLHWFTLIFTTFCLLLNLGLICSSFSSFLRQSFRPLILGFGLKNNQVFVYILWLFFFLVVLGFELSNTLAKQAFYHLSPIIRYLQLNISL
jgi:hypothetical protein